jgi:hypothetical protein
MNATPDTPGWIGPKPWDKCSDAEKIERLRQEVEDWRRVYAELRDRLDLLDTHQHGPNGVLVVDMQQAYRWHRALSGVGSINMLR